MIVLAVVAVPAITLLIKLARRKPVRVLQEELNDFFVVLHLFQFREGDPVEYLFVIFELVKPISLR